MPRARSRPTAAAPASPEARAEAWFAAHGWTPFAFQREVWAAYRAGESGLIHAATGTGKTYAAWFGPLLEALAEPPPPPPAPPADGAPAARRARAGSRAAAPPLRVLWITPLRALAADTEAALRAPLAELSPGWTLESRTGDTPATVRARQRERLPTALVTTPESLALLLARADAPALFAELRCVVVDEWHELMGTKRGVHAELCLARLRAFRPGVRTWGVSATIGNLEEARETLLGAASAGGRIVRGVVPKSVVVDALVPPRIERFPWAGHLGTQMLPQVVAAVEEGRTAIVFTNTRSQTEIWFQALLDARPDWAGVLALHHGSLDRKTRDFVEEGLRTGRLRCVVATSSLDLGVDFSPVDRVLQIGSPKGVARLLQRAGRSGHRPGVASRVTCVPTHALELIEVAAARDGVEAAAVERRLPVERPLDLLAQHVVGIAVGTGFRPDALRDEVRTTRAYRDLSDAEWRWVLDFVTRGGDALRAYPEYRRVVAGEDGVYRVESAAVARRHRMSVGTIVSDAAIAVQFVRGARIGTVEEGFIARLKPGDRFVFGGRALEFVRVRDLVAWVRRAPSTRGAIPRWAGGRMPLSSELAHLLRARLDEARRGVFRGPEMEAVRPILEVQARWSALPGAHQLLVERVETREGHHVYLYPFEGRLVHEGLAALLAWRLSRRAPITFTLAANDYGVELLSPEPAPLEAALAEGLLSPDGLAEDVAASLNATEMAKRQFREIARVAGLVFPGFPHAGKTARQLQASSGLFFDVFQRFDPGNLLVGQAHREVLERQLESSRLAATLARLSAAEVVLTRPERTPPLAFPLMVDRLREALSSESVTERIRRMQLRLETAADDG